MSEWTKQQAKPKSKDSWMAHLIRQGWRYSYKYKLQGHILVWTEGISSSLEFWSLVWWKRVTETARPRGPRIKAGTPPPKMHRRKDSGFLDYQSTRHRLYLLTERESRTEKYLARGPYVLREPNIFPSGLTDLSQYAVYHMTVVFFNSSDRANPHRSVRFSSRTVSVFSGLITWRV